MNGKFQIVTREICPSNETALRKILHAVKKRHKINIVPYGEIFIIYLIRIKFKIWRVTFFKRFFYH